MMLGILAFLLCSIIRMTDMKQNFTLENLGKNPMWVETWFIAFILVSHSNLND